VDLMMDLVISQEYGPLGHLILTTDIHLVEITQAAYRVRLVLKRQINLAAWCNVKFGVQMDSSVGTPRLNVKFSQSLNGDDGQLVKCVPVHGFINATKMCKSACTKMEQEKI
jgi:hypothetical protein